MTHQYFTNWDQRYLLGDTPWEDPGVWPLLAETFSNFPPTSEKTLSVLEVGCGNGANSVALAALGYRVLGIDVSAQAIGQAIAIHGPVAGCSFSVGDFFSVAELGKFDLLFDRGCFHHCSSDESRRRFVTRASETLNHSGSWISVMGDGDSDRSCHNWLHPAVPMEALLASIEGLFVPALISSVTYGVSAGSTNFPAYVAVLTRLGD